MGFYDKGMRNHVDMWVKKSMNRHASNLHICNTRTVENATEASTRIP